jgi:hypothetical protein
MNVKCEKFREYIKNSLQGFADLVVEPPGIRIHDCTLQHSVDKSWVGLPARPYEKDGKQSWARIIDFATRTGYFEFQEAALKAISDFRGRAGTPPPPSRPSGAPRAKISDADIPF